MDDHIHVCQVCSSETVYHVFDHESQEDIVTAYCDSCGEDTQHEIGSWQY